MISKEVKQRGEFTQSLKILLLYIASWNAFSNAHEHTGDWAFSVINIFIHTFGKHSVSYSVITLNRKAIAYEFFK